MGELTLTPSNTKRPKEDKLHVNKSAGSINGGLSIFRFKDKDTHQFIYYCPSLDLSGYGESKEKAFAMLKFSISDLFDHILHLSLKQIEVELRDFGWKKNRIFQKQYSKSYVDIDGVLQNFNAEEGSIERFELHAA